jgi:uncharacterized protein (DUF736 family)
MFGSYNSVRLLAVTFGRKGEVNLCPNPNKKGTPMIIGNFLYDPEKDTYSGDITTLTLQRDNVSLRPNKKSGEREPDYRIVHEQGGASVEFGAAWKRESEKGRAFLSLVLDDPALPTPVNAALFLSDADATARLVWQRPAKKDPEPEENSTPKRTRRSGSPRPKESELTM